MATGVIKDATIIGLEAESTEGTYVAPSATTSYFQPLQDGWELIPIVPTLERKVLSASIGHATPRAGQKSCTATMPVELRASGTEGAVTDFDYMYKGAFGTSRAISTTTTTKGSGNTGSVLQIEDADISKFTVGDVIVIKESGLHWPCAVTAVVTTGGSANITVTPSKPTGSFSNSVVISKTTTYYPANSGHNSISLSVYEGNEKRLAGIGMKVNSMSIDNFTPGALASVKFGLEGLNYTVANGVAPHTPSYDSGVPPTILNACMYIGSTEYRISQFGLTIANTLGKITSTCSSTGVDGMRVIERVVSGTINPYMDDTTTTLEDYLASKGEFSIFISAYVPSSTSGEMTFGSCIGIWLPQVIVDTEKYGDNEGILTNEIAFKATRGSTGGSNEIFMGFI